MKLEQIPSVQSWLPIEKILEKGIIKLKNSSYIKIMYVSPINYNLKSDLEKEAILNSFKNFFKSCNFNLQILIQSKKEDLSKQINYLNNNSNCPAELKNNYIDYIDSLNKKRKSSCKNFFIVVSENSSENNESNVIQNLQNKYNKIKDSLSRCGNIVSEYTEDDQILEVLYSSLNSNKI